MRATASPRLRRAILGRLRLAPQGLAGSGCLSVPEAVRWMQAVPAPGRRALFRTDRPVSGSGVCLVPFAGLKLVAVLLGGLGMA